MEDLYYSLAERFLRRVRFQSPRALSALRGASVLYLANHQVAIESLLFSVVMSGLSEQPTITLAKAEHRTSWLGLLIKHAFSFPGVTDPGVITFFDRGAQDELPKVVLGLAEALSRSEKSVMVHVEGTRALSSRAPGAKMSGAFLDMALATGTPVVPVRFVGGLPVEPVSKRLEFPVGMGRQDILIGEPISTKELSKLHYKERKERVIAAINALAPVNEEPSPAEPEFAGRVLAWQEQTGASEEHSVLYESLRRWSSPCEETRSLFAAIERGHAISGTTPRDRWLVALARRLASPCPLPESLQGRLGKPGGGD
ncbi:MAG: 1-acyl-sn-glycerol-3-phosphate acyltransferase [Deltaproteobacteria bacterium]|nr:1-acyl-sn-glycerol-3-phosphate acyltransferase [Deltaproteobacteria bacterium]